MLTPQDIQDVKFDRSMKGYDKEQVEEFLDAVQSDYTALYKENATLKGKMRVLVDKIEEYRQVDEQMRKAFYTAQVTAQETIAKAQAEAEIILRNARNEADGKVEDLRAEIAAEEQRLAVAKADCQQYGALLRRMLEENIRALGEHIDRVDELMAMPINQLMPQQIRAAAPAPAAAEVPAEVPAAEPETEPSDDLMADTFDLDKELGALAAAAGKKPAKPEEDEDDDRIRFTELRFGKEYKDHNFES